MSSNMIHTDLSRCIACHACQEACGREHGGAKNVYLAASANRTVPLACRQCEPMPCLAVCLPGALRRAGDAVLVDDEKCTGCGLCLWACPFGVMGLSGNGRPAHTCDLCLARLERGSKPACVLTCPSKALAYGSYEDLAAPGRRRAAAIQVRAAARGEGR